MSHKLPSEQDLIRAGIRLATTICGWCSLPIRDLLKQLSIEERNYKNPNNVSRVLDSVAHNFAVFELKREFGQQIYIYGEEASGTPKSLERINKVVAVVDAVDGTDLVARGLSNWCSAFAFFIPKQKKILATVVGHSSGEVYFASSEGAYKKPVQGPSRRLKRNPNEKLALSDASVCFYGQKPNNLLTVVTDEASKGFQQKLATFRHRMTEQKEKLPFRLYNFGGNPMMVKIPERTVDAVFELSGQKPHDVIPGTYIAVQGGAILMDLQGNEIDPAQALLTPNKKMKYVLAATRSLANELRSSLVPEGPTGSTPVRGPSLQSLPFEGDGNGTN